LSATFDIREFPEGNRIALIFLQGSLLWVRAPQNGAAISQYVAKWELNCKLFIIGRVFNEKTVCGRQLEDEYR